MSTYKVYNKCRTLLSKCTITVKLSTSCSGSFIILYLVLQTIHKKWIITVELYIQSVQLLSNYSTMSTYKVYNYCQTLRTGCDGVTRCSNMSSQKPMMPTNGSHNSLQVCKQQLYKETLIGILVQMLEIKQGSYETFSC